MQNDFNFWNEYLFKIKNRILELCNEKEYLYIDMHIHSIYSSDGKQSIIDIINTTKEKGFDIISITDHDSIDAYDELYEIIKNDLTTPIIIPGIEFTIDNRDYGNQCHILQLFINPKDKELINNVKRNYKSSFNRSKIQIKRLKSNKAIKELMKENNINFSYTEYINFLDKNNLIPEYDTLSEYIMQKFKSKKITTFMILEILEKYNKLDCYEDRKKYIENRYQKLRIKYQNTKENYYNSRLLLSMLAVKEVDDDWWKEPIWGSLSVNSYGQLKIYELNKKFPTFFAHPTEKKLDIVEKIIIENKNIKGMEKNIRNEYLNIDSFNNLLKDQNLYKIIGSDSHDNTMNFYKDMTYFQIKSHKVKEIILGDSYGKN